MRGGRRYGLGMVCSDRRDRAEGAERLGRSAVDWILRHDGADWADPSLYHGQAGILLALNEAHAHFDDPGYANAVDHGGEVLAASLNEVADCSLYFGLSGIGFTLHAIGRDEAAGQALRLLRDRCRNGRWGPMFELLGGNAGIGLGALHAGDIDLAVDAVTPYLQAATRTAHGVNWPVRPSPPRSHHIAHGTLGIVYALATIGQAAKRLDLIEIALEGAADVVGRNEAGPDGFLVAHSDPPHRPDLIERYSLGWCNGPTGDAQVFRLLAQITGDLDWERLADQCWHTVTTSGLPQRIRPGFWDNNGRCCGTAGVLALALDRIVEKGDAFDFADLLVDDLTSRATIDRSGAAWSNHEHRASPPTLAPGPGWAMGNAGIVRELLRYARLCSNQPDAYAIPWPDHPPTTT